MAKGVIYILTNPSFPEYVKIGYTDDLEYRLGQLNRGQATPFSFRAYATYDVDKRLSDKKLHRLIDQLNPDLRSIETINGKKRVREFFAMEPEEAYAILEAIAEISGTKNRLHRVTPTGKQVEEEKLAEEIKSDSKRRRFTFSMVGIPVGATIHFTKDENITAEVVDDRNIRIDGEVTSLSAAAHKALGKPDYYHVAGPRFWTYEGQVLDDMRSDQSQ